MSTTTSTILSRRNVWRNIGGIALVTGAFLLPSETLQAQTNKWQWANSGAGPTVGSTCAQPAIDQSENIYLIGGFRSSGPAMKFSNSTVSLTDLNPGLFTLFMTKYHKNGNLLWAKSFKSGYVDGEMIAVEQEGGIYCTLVYKDFIKIDSTTINGNGSDWTQLLAKFTTNGDLVWAKNITSSSGGYYVSYQAMELNAQGQLYLTGSFNKNTITFNSVSLNNSNSAGTSYDGFTVKFDANGNAVSGTVMGTASRNDFTWSLCFNNTGAVYTGTSYQDTGVITQGGQVRIYKHDNAGNPVWTKTGNSPTGAALSGMATDATDNLYITGYYGSDFQMDGIALDEPGGGIYVAKFNNLGSHVWSRSSKGNAPDISTFPSGIGVDQSGTVSIGGSYVYSLVSPTTTITFDTVTLTLEGSRDDFFVQYTNDGKLIRATNISGSLSEYASGLKVLSNGNIYYTGSFYSPSVALGDVTLTNTPDSIGNYYGKFFLAKYGPGTGTGIGSIAKDVTIKVYPNPTDGIFSLDASKGIKALKITDQLGRALYDRQFSGTVRQHQLDISHYSKGQYYLLINTEKGDIVKTITLK